ncbi:ATP-binding protein [Stigmatella sp. ncwal1]|uniref:ATP-binding protein n=1 Tax=Stigmatella ashevillensis TaxID=2995309 RepID=A0ABT5DLZ7_9BACT|nr:ATP-binding protein [Stigmatella ashevillena]MDC0713748.1 ATP-binding protein [Stigmatella ashevillena]
MLLPTDPARLCVPIRLRSDTAVAAAMGRHFARGAGLAMSASAEVALVVSELASNLVRHAGDGGTVELWLEADWLIIRAQDRGPGMPQPEQLFAGREGRLGPLPGESLGEGGPAIRRLTDAVHASNREGGGLEVVARKRRSAGFRKDWP